LFTGVRIERGEFNLAERLPMVVEPEKGKRVSSE
jgi:hypothetical protein